MSLQCQQCGAPLPRSRRSPLRCEHCGSLADRGSPAARDGDDAPSSERPHPYPVAEQYGWLLPFIGMLAAFTVGVAVWSWSSSLSRPKPRPEPALATPAPAAPSPPPPRLLPGLVLFASAGSEEEDLWLVVEDPPSSGERWLERVSGATGRVLWKRPAREAADLGTGLRAWIDGGLLVAGAEKVAALSPESGALLWSRDSGRAIADLCEGQGFAGVRFPDDRVATFSVATGETLRDRAGPCEPAVTSRSVAPNFSMVEAGGIAPPLPPQPPFQGSAARVLVPHQGNARVVLAFDRLAATVAVAGRKWVWSTRLGQGQSRLPRFLVPPLAAVRNERVVVPYVIEPNVELRLASLELASGRLVWDRALTTENVQTARPDAELRISRAGAIYFADGTGRLWAMTLDATPAWSWGVE